MRCLSFHFLCRYPILEQPPVSRGAVCALHHIRGVPVSGSTALYPGQRDQLCRPGQRIHRPAHRFLEDYQSHGCQGEMMLHYFS